MSHIRKPDRRDRLSDIFGENVVFLTMWLFRPLFPCFAQQAQICRVTHGMLLWRSVKRRFPSLTERHI